MNNEIKLNSKGKDGNNRMTKAMFIENENGKILLHSGMKILVKFTWGKTEEFLIESVNEDYIYCIDEGYHEEVDYLEVDTITVLN